MRKIPRIFQLAKQLKQPIKEIHAEDGGISFVYKKNGKLVHSTYENAFEGIDKMLERLEQEVKLQS